MAAQAPNEFGCLSHALYETNNFINRDHLGLSMGSWLLITSAATILTGGILPLYVGLSFEIAEGSGLVLSLLIGGWNVLSPLGVGMAASSGFVEGVLGLTELLASGDMPSRGITELFAFAGSPYGMIAGVVGAVAADDAETGFQTGVWFGSLAAEVLQANAVRGTFRSPDSNTLARISDLSQFVLGGVTLGNPPVLDQRISQPILVQSESIEPVASPPVSTQTSPGSSSPMQNSASTSYQLFSGNNNYNDSASETVQSSSTMQPSWLMPQPATQFDPPTSSAVPFFDPAPFLPDYMGGVAPDESNQQQESESEDGTFLYLP
jgi:hypothetical protein